MFFLFKQKTAYDVRISDWSSDVCSSELSLLAEEEGRRQEGRQQEEDGKEGHEEGCPAQGREEGPGEEGRREEDGEEGRAPQDCEEGVGEEGHEEGGTA